MSDLSTRFLKLQTRSTFWELVPLEISKRTSWKTDVRHFCVLFEDMEASVWAAHSNKKGEAQDLKADIKANSATLSSGFYQTASGALARSVWCGKSYGMLSELHQKTFLAWPLPVVSQHVINLLPELIFPAWFPTLQLSPESFSSYTACTTHGLVQ